MAAVLQESNNVKVIPGVGHWIQAEAPDEINTELLRWFSGEIVGKPG